MPDNPTPVSKPEGASRKHLAAQARRAALLHHTRALMLEQGPHNVSLAEVLRRAGGSKATVVKYFGDRNGLIAATVREIATAAMLELAPQEADVSLSSALTHRLAGILRFYLKPDSLAVYRGIIAGGGKDNGKDGGVGAAFLNAGHQYVVDSLAQCLESWKGRGIRPDLPAREAAEQLSHALRSGLYESVLLGVQPAPEEDHAVREKAGAVARLFLQGMAS